MKYVIDLPDEYDRSWVVMDMPTDIKADGTTYKRYRLSLEPYKPEPEPKTEVLEVGDEVIDSAGRLAYVFSPNYENDNKVMILLMDGYAVPQIARKILWKKTGRNKESIKSLVRLAYKALNEVDK